MDLDLRQLQLLAEAVHVSLSGDATAAQREQARQLLEQVKALPSCAAYGLFLARVQPQSPLGPLHTAEVRLVGVQLLEHAVRHQWQSYTELQTQEMKQTVLNDLMARGTLPLGQEQLFILRKIAELTAEIAKRDWPQRWPDFMPGLMQVCQLGSTQAYMAINTIKTLAEDIIDFNDDLDTGRRADLQKALQACLPDIVPFLLAAAGCGGDDAVVEAALDALNVISGWAPIPNMLADEQLIGTLCGLLHNPLHRQASVEILLQLSERKGTKSDRVPILRIFRHLPAIVQSVPQLDSTDASAIDDKAYAFVKRVCQMLSVLGAAQLAPLWALSFVKQPPEHFDLYAQALMGFATHPSPLVCSFTLPCWTQLIKLNEARSQPAFQSLILPLLEQLSMRIMTYSGDPQTGFVGADAAFNDLDFASTEEYLAFTNLFRSHVAGVARAIAAVIPREAVHHVAQLLSTLMEVSNAAEGVRPPPTALYAAWDGLALLWEAVMSEAYPLVEANFVRGRGPGVTLDVLKQCFEAALKFDSQDPQLLMSELTVLGSLLPCLRLVPEGMAYVLHKLFAALEFNAEQDRELQERNMASGARQKTGLTESAQVRRKAGMLLVQLCSKPPPCFIDSLDTVLQRSHALLSQPSLAEMTHNQLVAALASSLNALPDPQLHTRYLDEMSRPFVADWLSADMTALLSNPEQFIEAAALMSPGVDALTLRRRVVLTLTALQTILQNTQPRGPDGKLLATSSIESLDAAASAATGSEGTATGGKGKNKGPAPLGSGGSRGTSMSPAAGRYSGPLTPDAYPSADLSRACVRNALVLCQTLHWLWTPDSPLAQSAFSALLELRRSDMYAALSRQLDMASISREMTADELWLDRTQLWLATLREAAYCLVQQAARQGTLFESAELIQLVQSCALQGLPSMQKRHLKLIVRHIIDPTLRYCPRLPDVMAQVLPVVAGAYQGVVDALLLFWDAKRQAVKAGAGGGGEGAEDDAQTNGGLNGGLARAGGGRGSRRGRQSADAQGGEFLTTEQREILEDKALQDVTEVLLRHIEQLLTTQGAAAAAAGGKGGGGGGSSSSGGAAAGASVGSLDELAALVMHTDASALPIIRFLCATATVPSSLVAGKAVTALTRLVLTLGSTSGAYRGLVAQHVLPTALESLSIHGEHSDNQSSLLMLVLRCIEVAHQEPVVGEVLSRVPGATPQALAAILQVPPSGRGADGSGGGGGGGGSATVAQRQQRQLLRQFLQPIMGVNIGQAWKDDVRVRDLPERLFLAKATENNSEEDDGVAGEIFAAVFDS